MLVTGTRAIFETICSTSRTVTVRSGLAGEAERRAHLVHDVDGLVRQEAVVDIALGQFGGGPDRRFGIADMMVLFIA